MTGPGFGLVAAPFLVLLLGPFEGILVSNLLGCVVSCVVLAVTWRNVDVRRVVMLTRPALVAVPVGAAMTRLLPGPQLLITVGTLVLLGLSAVLVSEWARIFRGTAGTLSAGAMSGFMNAKCGDRGTRGHVVRVGHRLATADSRPVRPVLLRRRQRRIAGRQRPSHGASPPGTLVLTFAVLAAGLGAGRS